MSVFWEGTASDLESVLGSVPRSSTILLQTFEKH